MKNIKKDNGNVVIIAMIFVGIFMVVLLFVAAIFMSNVNSILHSVKTDMYTINKSAIMAVNKNKANVDKFEYDEREYKRYFSQMLKKNYDLNKLEEVLFVNLKELIQNNMYDNPRNRERTEEILKVIDLL